MAGCGWQSCGQLQMSGLTDTTTSLRQSGGFGLDWELVTRTRSVMSANNILSLKFVHNYEILNLKNLLMKLSTIAHQPVMMLFKVTLAVLIPCCYTFKFD